MGNEPGHRDKFANAFVSIVDMEQQPRRWVAGKDAVDDVIAKGKQLVADATAYLDLSTNLDYED
ncbi:hypothetical protein PM729_05750 [Enterococcus mundtii]|uniref:hypothetical protein n=1 Tax=Enterococcus mundtii TaxID=53346 RepID=UPI00232D6578|nr:hypothetical protein [Enterococcus mundtii]MDB7087192.1 hypothetical protein [Enterococcus mundtii]